MSDLISRQAAIDALEETDWYHQNKNKDMVHGANSAKHQAWYKEQDVFKAIEQLPSEQPSTQLIAEIKVSKEDMDELLAEKDDAPTIIPAEESET